MSTPPLPVLTSSPSPSLKTSSPLSLTLAVPTFHLLLAGSLPLMAHPSVFLPVNGSSGVDLSAARTASARTVSPATVNRAMRDRNMVRLLGRKEWSRQRHDQHMQIALRGGWSYLRSSANSAGGECRLTASTCLLSGVNAALMKNAPGISIRAASRPFSRLMMSRLDGVRAPGTAPPH